MAQAIEKVGGRKTLGAAAHDRQPVFTLRGPGRVNALAGFHFIVGCKAFQGINGNRVIHQVPAAFKLTGMHADAAADRWKGIGFLDDPNGPEISPFCYFTDIGRDVNTGRTGPLTGRGTLFCGVFPHKPSGI